MTRKAAAGYTLIEILVAISIFAVVSAMSFAGLWRALDMCLRIETEREFWSDVSLAFVRMRADVSEVRDRPVGSADAPVRVGSASLELVSTQESKIRLITYRAIDGTLTRSVSPWPMESMRTSDQVLLRGLSGFQVRLVAQPHAAPGTRPQAVEVRLSIEGRGEFTRLFACSNG